MKKKVRKAMSYETDYFLPRIVKPVVQKDLDAFGWNCGLCRYWLPLGERKNKGVCLKDKNSGNTLGYDCITGQECDIFEPAAKLEVIVKRLNEDIGYDDGKGEQNICNASQISQIYYNAIEHPEHYTQGEIECIDAIKESLGEGFNDYCIGNVMKYIWRYKHKNGIEDLKKARWYLDRVIEHG